MTDEANESDELRLAFELRLERLLDAPRVNVWRCWSEPELLKQWFAPESWTAEVKALEQRPGGASHILLRGPGGELSDGVGVYLEAVPGQRLVFTNAYHAGWIPALEPAVVPFMTTFVELSDEDGQTRHVVRALHWTEEAQKRHEEIGFHDGWRRAADRLEGLARSLGRPGTCSLAVCPSQPDRDRATKAASAMTTKPRLLSGGNPQIPKGEGDAPVQAYIDAVSGWKQEVCRRLDLVIARIVPGVRKSVKWNSPFYGAPGEEGWFLSFHVFTKYAKVTFFRGTSLDPVPSGKSRHPEVRYLDIYEGELDEAQFAEWVKQASQLPGQKM